MQGESWARFYSLLSKKKAVGGRLIVLQAILQDLSELLLTNWDGGNLEHTLLIDDEREGEDFKKEAKKV